MRHEGKCPGAYAPRITPWKYRIVSFLLRVIVTAAALWLCTVLIDGITVGGEGVAANIGTLLAVALIFGVINAVLKPIIKGIGCAFYVLTLGLFALVVNAGLLLLTGWLAELLSLPFQVDGFWAAFWGAILVGVVSWVAGLFLGDD